MKKTRIVIVLSIVICFFIFEKQYRVFAQDHSEVKEVKCGVLTFNDPSTTLSDITGGTNCKKHFTADATFDPNAPHACKCCEFRQYVKGGFAVDGNKVPVKLVAVDPTAVGPFAAGTEPTVEIDLDTVFHEDWRDYPRVGKTRYGHRNERGKAADKFSKGGSGADAPNVDDNGCSYHMLDEPGFDNCQSGHSYTVDLTFKDEVVSVCTGCDGCKSYEFVAKVTKTQP